MKTPLPINMNQASIRAGTILLLLTLCLHCARGHLKEEDAPGGRLDLDDPTEYFRSNKPPLKGFNDRLTFDQYITYALRSLTLVVGWDNDLHRYDTKSSLIKSFARNLTYLDDLGHLKAHIDPSEATLLGDQSELVVLENELNQVRCGKHLDKLLLATGALLANATNFSLSKQLNLIDFLDSFGWPNSQLMMGNTMWLGSHQQCAQSSLEDIEAELGARYCIAKLRSPHWPAPSAATSTGSQTLKLGVCLPSSCNTISLLRHKRRISTLIELNRLGKIVPLSSYQLVDLYCLPDESSPLRQFSWSAKIFILTLSSWITIVIYYSLVYEFKRMKSLHKYGNTEKLDKTAGKLLKILAFRLAFETLFGRHVRSSDSQQKAAPNYVVRIFDQQVDREKEMRVSNIKMIAGDLAINSNKLNLSREVGQRSEQKVQENKKKNCADLSIIDGIKVISMMWLITGHTLMFFLRTISNGRDFWDILSDARYMIALAGIFPVDTFFTITGFLTSYLKFNKSDGKELHKFSYWLEAFVHRYLRFMPMYLFVFWYTRDVSEYIGFGPLWDYATVDTSLRSVCKQESFSVPLFFQANFKRIDQHCVKPAWYLANDYQFLLITPLFLNLVRRSRTLGYSVIGLSVLISLGLQFLTVFFPEQALFDFRVVINFRPMFATHVLKDLWKLYVLPYNRITPYLIGILTGHLLYTWNRQPDAKKSDSEEDGDNFRHRYRKSQDSSTESDNSSDNGGKENIIRKKKKDFHLVEALQSYLCTKVWIPLMLLISIIYSPILARFLDLEGLAAKIGTSSLLALMRFIWSMAIARLIYICASSNQMQTSSMDTTNPLKPTRSDSFVIRFLSSPKWKPWSRIGLSALLIQWEVISYFAQIQTSAPQMTVAFVLAVVLSCIVVTYMLALILYLTIEYPLSQVEQLYIQPALFNKT